MTLSIFLSYPDVYRLRQAYRGFAQFHHPDKGGDPEAWRKTTAAYKAALALLESPLAPGGIWTAPDGRRVAMGQIDAIKATQEVHRLRNALAVLERKEANLEARIASWCLLPDDPAGKRRMADHREPLILERRYLEGSIALFELIHDAMEGV